MRASTRSLPIASPRAAVTPGEAHRFSDAGRGPCCWSPSRTSQGGIRSRQHPTPSKPAPPRFRTKVAITVILLESLQGAGDGVGVLPSRPRRNTAPALRPTAIADAVPSLGLGAGVHRGRGERPAWWIR
jgi:hypothetical protein